MVNNLYLFLNKNKISFFLCHLGLVVGAIIRYTGQVPETRVLPVIPAYGDNCNCVTTYPLQLHYIHYITGTHYNHSVPPDVLWLQLSKRLTPKASGAYLNNRTFVYTFKGEVDNTLLTEIDQKVILA